MIERENKRRIWIVKIKAGGAELFIWDLILVISMHGADMVPSFGISVRSLLKAAVVTL